MDTYKTKRHNYSLNLIVVISLYLADLYIFEYIEVLLCRWSVIRFNIICIIQRPYMNCFNLKFSKELNKNVYIFQKYKKREDIKLISFLNLI